MGESTPHHEPRGNWSTLFQRSSAPVFLLSRRRQIRYVNPAWEQLTGKSAESFRGQFCVPRKTLGTQPVRALLQAMAPPPEILKGQVATVRRPAPPAKLGPPWWEITFVPLEEGTSLSAILGYIRPVEQDGAPPPASTLSEAMMALRMQAATRYSFEAFLAGSAAMKRVVAQARLASNCREPVWIVGETGVGKESLARTIHFQGITREQTFLAIDSGGLQPYLIRAMLFGRTGQANAQLGTVYLKNAAALPRELQSEIVEWVDEQETPPRIVVAVREEESSPLVESFETAFHVLEIRLPPLRERRADLPAIIEATRRSRGLPELTPAVADLLTRHDWPGNLRELDRALRDAAGAAGGNRIEAAHLPLALRVADSPRVRPTPPLDTVLEQVERRMLILALQKAKGNKSEAAEALGIPRGRLLRRLEALGIAVKE